MENDTAVLASLPRSGEADFGPDLTLKSPPLCTHTAQVPKFELNPSQINELCKIEVISWLTENGYLHDAYTITNCGTTFVHLKDENGHEKYVRMHCKHDYCPICGENGSQAHKKRYIRALDRLVWANTLGYMVFTLPKEVSLNMPSSAVLSDLSKKAWDLVKKNFDTPGGMARVHLLGEEPEKLHIHINVLFPIVNEGGKGEVPQATLDSVRSDWTAYINKIFKLACGTTNVFYKFAYREGRKIHQVKYVLRPIVTPDKFLTLSDSDREKVLGLRGWHNTRWFGKLANSQYKNYLKAMGIEPKQYENKDIMLSKKCPICGKAFRFIEIVSENAINRLQLRAIDRDVLVDFAIYSFLKENST